MNTSQHELITSLLNSKSVYSNKEVSGVSVMRVATGSNRRLVITTKNNDDVTSTHTVRQ